MVHCWWYSECNRICWPWRRTVTPRHSALPSPAWRRSADQRRLVEERQLRSRISSLLSSHSTTSLRMRQHLVVDYRQVSVLERVGRRCPWRANAVMTIALLFNNFADRRSDSSSKNRWWLPASVFFVCSASNTFVAMDSRLQFFFPINHCAVLRSVLQRVL